MEEPPLKSGVRVDTECSFPGAAYATVQLLGSNYVKLVFANGEYIHPDRAASTHWREAPRFPPNQYDAVACLGPDEWCVKQAGRVHKMPRALLARDVDELLLARCERKCACWLPVDNTFVALKWRADGTWEGVHGSFTEPALPPEYVRRYFQASLLEACKANVGKAMPVQAGAARKRGGAPAPSMPAVRYQQGEQQTCVFASAASALHDAAPAFGVDAAVCEAAAATLMESAPASLASAKRVHFLLDTVRRQLKGFTAEMLPASFDPLTDDSPYPTVFVPEGSDGQRTHAVCALGARLYDASRAHALPFGTAKQRKEALDLSVREADGDAVTYVRIPPIKGRGVRILPGSALQKRKADALAPASKCARAA